MIMSLHEDACHHDFISLIEKSTSIIRLKASEAPRLFLGMAPTTFEQELCNAFNEAAVGTDFAGSIELISGQKFPDITIKNKYGIEVKTTRQDKWISTGNSIFETTRVESVEHIYIFFAKLAGEIDFRFRRYQDCLYKIGVTHSPRYFIDMDTPANESIFHKMNIDYEELRRLDNPAEPFKRYLRAQIKPGEEPWWLDESDTLLEPVVKPFSDLTDAQKERILIEAMIFFPEIFSNSTSKYKRLPAWLVVNHGVVSHNIRDLFTAGGQGTVQVQDSHYQNIPKIFIKLAAVFEKVTALLGTISQEKLEYYWGQTFSGNPLDLWIRLLIDHSNSQLTHPELRKFMVHLCSHNHIGVKPDFLRKLEDDVGLYQRG